MQTHARLSDVEARRKAIGWLDRVAFRRQRNVSMHIRTSFPVDSGSGW